MATRKYKKSVKKSPKSLPKRKARKIGRDAITGRFLALKVAMRRKKTAIVQTIYFPA